MEKYELEIIDVDNSEESMLDSDQNIRTVVRLVQRTKDRGFYVLGWVHSKENVEYVANYDEHYMDMILENIRKNTFLKVRRDV